MIDVGPSKWFEQYPQCDETLPNRQSPIDIETLKASGRMYKRPFAITPNQVTKMTLENTGHSVQMTFVDPLEVPTISWGNLLHEYKFAQMHFHWHSETYINSKP